jgi:hypothetical protein
VPRNWRPVVPPLHRCDEAPVARRPAGCRT